jgi:hypothetical protein
LPLFLISLKAGGQGLNLTSADYVFILDPWWNPAVEAQAVDRAYAHRPDSTRVRLPADLPRFDRGKDPGDAGRQTSGRDAILSEDNSVLRDLTAEDLERLLS